jgi:energy-coupling factor transport system permease protein
MTGSLLFYVVVLSSLLAVLLCAQVGLGALFRNFRPLIILVGVTALYHLAFSGKNTTTLLDIFGWRITSGGLQMAGFYSLRLILFITVAFLMTLTNSPSELAEAFTRILRPLKAIKVPVHDLSLILFMAIRFIPVLYEEFVAIRNAQIMRGVDFSGSLVNRIRKTAYIIIPVFVSAIQRADDIALAIQARGYDRAPERTFYSRSHFGKNELRFAILSSLFVAIVFYLTD